MRAIARRRSGPQGEGMPERLEILEPRGDFQRNDLRAADACSGAERGQPFGRAHRKPCGLVHRGSLRVDRGRGFPEGVDEAGSAAGIIPDIEGQKPARTQHPAHLAERRRRVGDEIQHEARGCGIHAPRCRRQRPRIGGPEPRPRIADRHMRMGDELLRGIGGQNRGRGAAPQDGRCQRAGAASRLDPVGPVRRVQPIEELVGDLPAPASHVMVIAPACAPRVMACLRRHAVLRWRSGRSGRDLPLQHPSTGSAALRASFRRTGRDRGRR